MMRLLGTVLLAGGCAFLGLCGVKHVNDRTKALRCLVAGLETMIRELDYRLVPLPELLREASGQTDGSVRSFFDMAAQGAEHLNGRTFQTVWEQSAEAAQLRLEEADLVVLEQLGAVLGRYDGENQRQAIAAAAVRLENRYRQAEDQSRRLGRVYSVLGLTAAAFLLILLI